MSDKFKICLDFSSFGVAIASLFDWMPRAAAFLSVVWLLIQIYDWVKNGRVNKD